MIRTLFLVLCLSATPLAALPTLDNAADVDFQKDVRPILADNCFACHGPDANARQADLRLDTREGAFADRGGYQVIVPGNAKASRLFERMSHAQEIARMPPPTADRHPTPDQVETIRRWIDAGAEWISHWAFEAPVRPAVPDIVETGRPTNEIDAFVLRRLQGLELGLSPEADRRTLLRRLSFDLTGLPPKPADVREFLSDTGPDAYEKQVDRLLDSPHYGERMAMQWLDLARYADTHGFHIDGRRDMWQWRDWVISAFNDNKPFDRFTVEQLAGDLLPEATLDQRIATGFNRNHMINHEGGAIPAEYHTEYVVDRVETVSTVWLAMTMGCARCHDHKYDPITQKEFYEFYAFFNSVDELGLDGVNGNAVPMLQLPDTSQQARLDQLDEAIRSVQADLPESRVRSQVAEWESVARGTIPHASKEGLEAHYEMDGGFADSSGNYRHGRLMRGEPLFRTAKAGQGAVFDVDSHVAFTGTEGIDLSQPFSVAFWFRHSGLVAKGLLHKMDGPASQRGLAMTLGAPVSIPDTLRREYDLIVRLSSSPDTAILARTKAPLRDARGEDATYHIVVSYDGSGRAGGLTLHVNGESAETTVLSDSLSGSPAVATPFEIGAGRFGGRYTGTLDDLRIYSRVLETEEIDVLYRHEPIRSILNDPYIDCAKVLSEAPPKPADDIYAPKPDTDVSRCQSRTSRLRSYYLSHAAPDTRPPPLQAAAGTEDGADRAAAAGAERDGHAGAPRASGDLHAGKRRLPEPHGQGVAGDPRLAPCAPRGRPAQSPRSRPVDRESGPSADGPGGGEPLLAVLLRGRPRQDSRGFRPPGRPSDTPGAARLARGGIRREWLGRQGPAEEDRHVGDIQAAVAGDFRAARPGSRERPAGPGLTPPAPG